MPAGLQCSKKSFLCGSVLRTKFLGGLGVDQGSNWTEGRAGEHIFWGVVGVLGNENIFLESIVMFWETTIAYLLKIIAREPRM